jgi:hypothetical protein
VLFGTLARSMTDYAKSYLAEQFSKVWPWSKSQHVPKQYITKKKKASVSA